MELQQLQHFLVLVRTGNIGKAAEELAITPSGLSRSLQALENFLALPLFVRHSRGVTITEFGDALLPYARSILHQRDRAIAELEAARALRRGRIKVAVHPVFDDTIVAGALNDFSRLFPEVEVNLWSGTDPELTRRELADSYDFGFTFFAGDRDEQALVYEHLIDMDVDVCTSGDAADGPLDADPEMLRNAEWVLLGGEAFRRTVDNHFRSRGFGPPTRVRVCSSLSLLYALLAQANRMTLLPRFVWRRHADRIRPVSSFIEPIPVAGGIVYGRNRSHDIPAQAMLTAFRAHGRAFLGEHSPPEAFQE